MNTDAVEMVTVRSFTEDGILNQELVIDAENAHEAFNAFVEQAQDIPHADGNTVVQMIDSSDFVIAEQIVQ